MTYWLGKNNSVWLSSYIIFSPLSSESTDWIHFMKKYFLKAEYDK